MAEKSKQRGLNGIAVDHLTVRYGGLVAVDDVSLEAAVGSITGLIGPNGAGKTTMFNACTGLLRPTKGTVRLLGHDVTAASPEARAQLGLGRTFQRMELFDSLTVAANVRLGREARLAGRNPLRHLLGRAEDNDEISDMAAEAMVLCEVEALRDARVADLSTGQRRLVELARTVASGASMLLLDEPSSGLDAVETQWFGGILRQLVAQRRVGVLLVEHDMALVMGVCAYLYVVDFGKPLFEGTPADVSSSSVVRAAYLGADSVSGAA